MRIRSGSGKRSEILSDTEIARAAVKGAFSGKPFSRVVYGTRFVHRGTRTRSTGAGREACAVDHELPMSAPEVAAQFGGHPLEKTP